MNHGPMPSVIELAGWDRSPFTDLSASDQEWAAQHVLDEAGKLGSHSNAKCFRVVTLRSEQYTDLRRACNVGFQSRFRRSGVAPATIFRATVAALSAGAVSKGRRIYWGEDGVATIPVPVSSRGVPVCSVGGTIPGDPLAELWRVSLWQTGSWRCLSLVPTCLYLVPGMLSRVRARWMHTSADNRLGWGAELFYALVYLSVVQGWLCGYAYRRASRWARAVAGWREASRSRLLGAGYALPADTDHHSSVAARARLSAVEGSQTFDADLQGCPLFMENPDGMLKDMPFMCVLLRYLQYVTYCSYGAWVMKRTCIWAVGVAWQALPICKNDCHSCWYTYNNGRVSRCWHPAVRSSGGWRGGICLGVCEGLHTGALCVGPCSTWSHT